MLLYEMRWKLTVKSRIWNVSESNVTPLGIYEEQSFGERNHETPVKPQSTLSLHRNRIGFKYYGHQ